MEGDLQNSANPPLFDPDKMQVSSWLKEVKMWRSVTSVTKTNKGLMIALYSFRPGSQLKNNVLDNFSEEELKAENGFEKITEFVESLYKKSELYTVHGHFTEFLRCKLKDYKSMDEYITEFQRLYNRAARSKTVELSDAARAFSLLENAHLDQNDRHLVLTGVDYEKANLHDQMAASLRKFFGEQAGSSVESLKSLTLKEETFCAVDKSDKSQSDVDKRDEDALYTAGFKNSGNLRGNYRGNHSRNFYNRGNGHRRGQGVGNRTAGNFTPKSNSTNNMQKSTQNRPHQDQFGDRPRCYTCGSIFHFSRACPDKQTSNHKVYETSHHTGEEAGEHNEFEEAYINVSYNVTNINSNTDETCLVAEAVNCAIVDTACTSTVCGQAWLTCFLDSLDTESKLKVKEYSSSKIFRFGNGSTLKSMKLFIIPCTIANKKLMLKTDVVSSDIPLLLGKPTMKRMHVTIDMKDDCAMIFGKNVKLDCIPSGHYCISVTKPQNEERNVENVLHVLSKSNPTDMRKVVLHLHRQFGHPTSRRLKLYFSKAGVEDKEYMKLIDDVSQSCETCPKWKKTPSRPIVCLPLASSFNEVIGMDLSVWDKNKNIYILHMTDLFTKFSLATVLTSKDSQEVIEKFIQSWIATGLGVPEKILVDNGGEFSSEYFKDMCENLNIIVMHTAAHSPFSNGVCERNHAVIDEMVRKMMADPSKQKLKTALSWAVNAKNSMQNVSGFSPYQLVYGRNPNLPNVLCNKPPALENTTISKVMLEQLGTMMASREAYANVEYSKKISEALKHKIRAPETVFEQGNMVYYKIENVKEWKGPGKIVGIDGKTLIIKHGSGTYRVHASKAMLMNPQVLAKENTTDKAHPPENDRDHNSNGLNRVVQDTDSESLQNDSNENDFEGFLTSVENGEDEEIFVCTDSARKTHVQEAKVVELEKWKEFGVYSEVSDKGQVALSCRWVITEKPDKGQPVKARLVARGYEEDLTDSDVRVDSPTAGKPLIKMFFAVLATKRWKCKSIDVKSAFLQGNKLDREVLLKSPKEAPNMNGKLWRLNKAVYGLSDASRVWYFTVKQRLLDLGCIQVKSEPAMFYWYDKNIFSGIFVMHVDDFLYGGTEEFQNKVIKSIMKHFKLGNQESGTFQYVGLNIKQTEKGIVMSQSSYLKTVKPIEVSNPKQNNSSALDKRQADDLRKVVGQLNWLGTQTRPDCSFEVLDLSISLKEPVKENILRANKTIRKLNYEDGEILFPDLGDLKKVKLVVFTDASHANLPDGYSSAGGFIIFLVGNNRCCPLAWEAKKIRRVVKSTLAAVTLALVEGLDMAFYLGSILTEIVYKTNGCKIPIECFVDNKSLCENTYSTKNVTEKRLRIDLASIKEMVTKGEVSRIKWVESAHQLSDCFTKRGVSCEKLLYTLKLGRFYRD